LPAGAAELLDPTSSKSSGASWTGVGRLGAGGPRRAPTLSSRRASARPRPRTPRRDSRRSPPSEAGA